MGRAMRPARSSGQIDLFLRSLADDRQEFEHFNVFTVILRDITARRNLENEVQDIAIQEQRRIGGDLHDLVGQELTALGLLSKTT
jgi:signal transduction histidine kinase